MTKLSAAIAKDGGRSCLADSVLIAESQSAPERFGMLFRRHAAEIHGYAARRLGVSAADDVVAETFLVAFRRRALYDQSRENARPWLYGIATNLIAHHRRAEARSYRALARTGVDPVTESFTDDALARMAAAHAQPLLADALARLKPGDRDVLLLFAWADLSYEQIAEALGIPIGTVRSRLHRARSQARQLVEALDPARERNDEQEEKRHG
jgi:RNA polymerase sigma-70 factor (ECF subfamily)